jgi:hypothetical protein
VDAAHISDGGKVGLGSLTFITTANTIIGIDVRATRSGFWSTFISEDSFPRWEWKDWI